MKDIVIKLIDRETSRKAHVILKTTDQNNKMLMTKKKDQDKNRNKSSDRDKNNKKRCFNSNNLNHQKNDCWYTHLEKASEMLLAKYLIKNSRKSVMK